MKRQDDDDDRQVKVSILPQQTLLSQQSAERERQNAKQIFESITEGKAKWDVYLLHEVLEKMNIYLPFPLTQIVFDAIDSDQSGYIEFPEFHSFLCSDDHLDIKDEYEATFETRPFNFSIIFQHNRDHCIISELHDSRARESILPRSKLIEVNGEICKKKTAQEVELMLHRAKLPVQLKLSKIVTKANLALMVEQGPWSMVHRDVEIIRRKERQRLHKASYDGGFHCPQEMGWQRHIFLTFDSESYSWLSRIIVTLVLILIMISTVAYVAETVPPFDKYEIWGPIEIVVSICFTIEYVMKISTCRNSWIFFVDLMNLIDLLAVIPFWIEACFETDGGGNSAMLRVVRVVRLARVFRLLKKPTFKQYLDVLIGALRKSIPSFGLLVTIILLTMVVFASLMYEVEKGTEQPDGTFTRPDDKESPFISIFAAAWWCIVTMTCVGYGDMYPITVLGQCLGVITMFSGLLVIAMPVIIIGGEFESKYKEFSQKKKQAKRETDLELIRDQEKMDAGLGKDEAEEQTEGLRYTEDYFQGLNAYINKTCEGYGQTDDDIIKFFTMEEMTKFVDEGYETQDEIIEVLKQGPECCYFLPESIERWKLFALYEIFGSKHQLAESSADDHLAKLRVAFFKKTSLKDDWEDLLCLKKDNEKNRNTWKNSRGR